VNGRRQARLDGRCLNDQAPVFEFKLPAVAEAQVVAIRHRHLHLNGGRAQVDHSPAGTQVALPGERLIEDRRGQFQVEFLGQLRDGRHKTFGQIFGGEGHGGWRGGCGLRLSHQQQGGQGGTAGDKNRGEIMVVDKELLSVKTKPRLRAGVVRVMIRRPTDQTKAMALSKAYNTNRGSVAGEGGRIPGK